MDVPSFDDAIQAPGDKLLAWDLNTRDGEHTLSIFSLAEGGAVQTAWRRAQPEDVEAITQDFEARGFRVGYYDYHGPFVWHITDAEIRIWDRKRQVLHAHDDVIDLTYDRFVNKADVDMVFAYASEDYIDRRVKVRLKDGEDKTLIYEFSAVAEADPTYSRNELIMDTEWCGAIAHALAVWCQASYKNLI